MYQLANKSKVELKEQLFGDSIFLSFLIPQYKGQIYIFRYISLPVFDP